MAKIEIQNAHGIKTDITTNAFAKDATNEDFGIVINGVYVGSFYVTERDGRSAIVFGAATDSDWEDALEHPRAVGDEAALFLPEELSRVAIDI